MVYDLPVMEQKPKDIVIAKEDAVFRLDEFGRWRNRHGLFEHPKIIDHFHKSIRKDDGGYFLFQSNGDYTEKVYFPYEDTALFAFGIAEEDGAIVLSLNTGRKVELSPEDLFVENDNLYMRLGDEVVKFSERALTRISERIEDKDGKYFLRYRGGMFPIPEK